MRADTSVLVFGGLVVFVWILVLNATVPPRLDPTIRAVFLQQESSIGSIDQPRSLKYSKTFALDAAAFPRRHSLRHVTVGDLRAEEHFFMEMDTVMDILRPGAFRFTIRSDDGFRLYIDGKIRAEYTTPRLSDSTQTVVQLGRGRHIIRIVWFQDAGLMELMGYYAAEDEPRLYYIGESSPFAKFSYPQEPREAAYMRELARELPELFKNKEAVPLPDLSDFQPVQARMGDYLKEVPGEETFHRVFSKGDIKFETYAFPNGKIYGFIVTHTRSGRKLRYADYENDGLFVPAVSSGKIDYAAFGFAPIQQKAQ